MSAHDSRSRFCACSDCNGAKVTGLLARELADRNLVRDIIREAMDGLSVREIALRASMPKPRVRVALRGLGDEVRDYTSWQGYARMGHAPHWKLAKKAPA